MPTFIFRRETVQVQLTCSCPIIVTADTLEDAEEEAWERRHEAPINPALTTTEYEETTLIHLHTPDPVFTKAVCDALDQPLLSSVDFTTPPGDDRYPPHTSS